ncbi:Ras-GEF domain-containing family member 1B [Folsomia candida]|uniref:Ras-GEF domain-containing family member 1B n=1 Tax=Folsomia candida TaxID=158441 RepID=A0A226EKY7_FOLCA|nr:Ras-GEF domain-containing family member 1B [Folsomia candida]
MAIYYYVRRLQKASKKNRTIHRDPIALNSNGSIPSVGSICTPVKASNKVSEVVIGSVTGPGLGAPSTLVRHGRIVRVPLYQFSPTTAKPQFVSCHGCSIPSPRFRNGTKGAGEIPHNSSSHLGKAVHHHVSLQKLMEFQKFFFLNSHITVKLQSDEDSIRIVPNLVRILGEWTQIFPYDFRDDNGLMMANVRAITHKCVHICPSMKTEVSILLTSLLDRFNLLEKFESNLAKINLEVQMASNHAIVEEESKLVKFYCNPRHVAEQLMLVELERFSFIGVQEFIQAFIKESCSPPSNSTTTSNSNTTGGTPSPIVNAHGGNAGRSGSKSKKSRLEFYVDWFHRLNLCVATDICKITRKKERVRVMEFWAKVGSDSVTLGNYNSAIAVFTAINSNPVRRLTKSWSKFTGQEDLSALESCFDPSDNFSRYRSRLKKGGYALVPGEVGVSGSSSSFMVLPFFSLLIKDLFFLKEAAASRLPNGHLAFSNFLQLGTKLSEVMRWQEHKADELNKVANLQHVIQTLPAFTESALMLSSFDCEGPANPEEEAILESLRRTVPPPPPEEEELTDSFQSLQIPSTSSGSTSGVHEDDSVGLSPSEIHKLLQCRFAHDAIFSGPKLSDIFSSNNLIGIGNYQQGEDGVCGAGLICSEAQIHQSPRTTIIADITNSVDNTGTIKQIKQKPPVPL